MSQIVRNESSFPGFAPGLRMFAKKVINNDTDINTYTFETKCLSILFAVAVDEDGAQTIPTDGASTVYVGTRNIVVTIPASKYSRFVVIGMAEDTNDDTVTITDVAVVADCD